MESIKLRDLYLSKSELIQQFNACHNRTQSLALFQNIFKFCKFFAQFFNSPFLTFFCLFSEKLHACPYFLE